jgi:hypothetical protein
MTINYLSARSPNRRPTLSVNHGPTAVSVTRLSIMFILGGPGGVEDHHDPWRSGPPPADSWSANPNAVPPVVACGRLSGDCGSHQRQPGDGFVEERLRRTAIVALGIRGCGSSGCQVKVPIEPSAVPVAFAVAELSRVESPVVVEDVDAMAPAKMRARHPRWGAAGGR